MWQKSTTQTVTKLRNLNSDKTKQAPAELEKDATPTSVNILPVYLYPLPHLLPFIFNILHFTFYYFTFFFYLLPFTFYFALALDFWVDFQILTFHFQLFTFNLYLTFYFWLLTSNFKFNNFYFWLSTRDLTFDFWHALALDVWLLTLDSREYYIECSF